MNRFLFFAINCLCVVFSCIGADIQLDKSTLFKGDSIYVSNKPYYNGSLYYHDLSEAHGIFDEKFNLIKGIYIIPGGGRIFKDSLLHNRRYVYTKLFLPGRYYFEKINTSIERQYDFDRGYWISDNLAYNSKEYKEKDLVDAQLMITLTKWIFYLGFIMLFIIKSVNSLFSNHQIKPMTWSVFILILILTILFLSIDNKYIEWSFMMPIFIWGILYGISKIVPDKAGHVINLLSIFIPMILVIYQFTVTKSSINLSDGEKVEIKWRRGTDLIKRKIIRNLIKKMEPVEPSQEYLCTTELTACEYSVITGELMSWISFIRPNAVKNDLSFDEVQQLIKELNDIIGSDYFRIPSKEIWEKALSPTDTAVIKPIKNEPHGINKGNVSAKGFIDLGDNLKELTSSGISYFYRNANNIPFKIPDYIVAMGGSYIESTTFFDETILPKNFSASNLGVRLAMDLSSQTEIPQIYGLLLDTIGTKLPTKIKLLEINGVKINRPWDEMERELIELSAYERDYTVQTSNGVIQTLSLPAYTEPYIFTPEIIE